MTSSGSSSKRDLLISKMKGVHKGVANISEQDFNSMNLLSGTDEVVEAIGFAGVIAGTCDHIGLEKIIDLDKQKKLADVIERQMRTATDLAGDVSRLSESIRQFESVKVYPDFAEQKKLVLKIEKWDEHRLLADVTALKASVVQYGIQMTHVENSEKEIACLKEQLPAVCPLCGSPLKDGCCEKN